MSAPHATLFERSRSARAAIWFMRVEQNTLSARRRRRFKRWISEPLNRAAFQAIANTWFASDPRALRASIHQQNAGSSTAGRSGAKPHRRRKGLTLVVTAAAILMAVTSMQVGRESDLAPTTTIVIRATEHQAMTLDDGSIVEVEPDTVLTVDFRPTQRLVHLTSGEALFDVAHDRQRPFIVGTETIRAEAIGTRFVVRVRDKRSFVTVEEGVVAVREPGSSEQAVVIMLRAGEQISLPATSIEDRRASAPRAQASRP